MGSKFEELKILIHRLKKNSKIELSPPVDKKLLEQTKTALPFFPQELEYFYSITNGCSKNEVSIFPIMDPNNIKKTWESLLRANTYGKSPFHIFSKDFLDNNLIFSHLGGMQVAVFSKQDHSIWYQEDENLFRTTLDLSSFLEGMAKLG